MYPYIVRKHRTTPERAHFARLKSRTENVMLFMQVIHIYSIAQHPVRRLCPIRSENLYDAVVKTSLYLHTTTVDTVFSLHENINTLRQPSRNIFFLSRVKDALAQTQARMTIPYEYQQSSRLLTLYSHLLATSFVCYTCDITMCPKACVLTASVK